MTYHDKISHFFAGAAIAATVALYLNPIWGFAAGVLAGAAKEIYDRIAYGGPDLKDFIATVLGALVVLPKEI